MFVGGTGPVAALLDLLLLFGQKSLQQLLSGRRYSLYIEKIRGKLIPVS